MLSTAEETLKQRNGNLLSIPLQPHCHCLWWMPAKSSYLWDESIINKAASSMMREREGTSSSSPLTLLSSNPLDCASHSVNGSRCCMIGLGSWHALRSLSQKEQYATRLVRALSILQFFYGVDVKEGKIWIFPILAWVCKNYPTSLDVNRCIVYHQLAFV